MPKVNVERKTNLGESKAEKKNWVKPIFILFSLFLFYLPEKKAASGVRLDHNPAARHCASAQRLTCCFSHYY